MKNLKEQIIEAVQDATDRIDGTVSIPLLDYFLDGILSKQLQQGGVVRPEVESAKGGELLPESDAQNGRVGVNGGQIGDLDIYQNLIEP